MKKYVVLFYLLCLWACSSDSSISAYSYNARFEEDPLHEGLVVVHAKNAFATLGTKNAKSRISERPRMISRFDYDYSLGKHEITYDDFCIFANEQWGFFSTFPGGSRPIVDLTFYDAVLYANARSKAEGYDTAYSYVEVNFGDEGHCTRMEGLYFHPEVDAYRLPTEAEWLLAAGANWNIDNAWLLENSNGTTHPVCSLGATENGFCDMAGNVMEWVNDWLGYFKDTTVYNFAGSSNGGSAGERIIKGGSFTTSKSGTQLYSRGDVYTVSSTNRANYVGFRIAFGKIPNPSWLNRGQVSVGGNSVSKATFTKIRSKTGTIHSKLAFRDGTTGKINFIDYAISPDMVFVVEDTLDCYHPEISPDGSHVAFSTGSEGIEGKSSVYVRMLTYDGDSLVRLDVENAAIPRWRVEGSDTMIVYVTDAGNNKNASDFSAKSTWRVKFMGNQFGKPEKLMDGAYHGGISYDNRLAVTGARLLRARLADSSQKGSVYDDSAEDSVWYNGEQACNASLSRDSSKRTLFLDFGGETGRKFANEKYEVHQRILIADSTGQLIQSIRAPEGYAFDHSEWANDGFGERIAKESNLIVASLTNVNGAHNKIVLTSTLDSSSLELVEGEELWHPNFWVDRSSIPMNSEISELDRDSAAIYYARQSDPLLAQKMNMFWVKASYVPIVALGSSRMSLGFIPKYLSVGQSLNMASIPSDMNLSYYLAKNYVLNHMKKLKHLVIGLDLDLWATMEDECIKSNILDIPGFHYDANHDFWPDTKKEDALKQLSRVYLGESYPLKMLSIQNGWVPDSNKYSWNEGHFGVDLHVMDSTWSDNSDTYEIALEKLTEIVKIAQEKNVNVLGVIFPQSPLYKKSGAFGRHGMRRTHAEQVIDRLKQMEQTYPNFRLLDENKMGNHDYPDSTAFDYDHLNAFGGEIITTRIDSVLKTFSDK